MTHAQNYAPCPERTEMVSFAADGTKSRVQRCGSTAAPTEGQYVTEDQCQSCPVRDAILSAAIAAKTFHPERKLDTSRATKKVPDSRGGGFVACNFRLLIELPVCCGGRIKTWQCTNTASSFYESEIAPSHCEGCKVRTPGEVPDGEKESQA